MEVADRLDVIESQLKEVVEFIRFMQQVVGEMADNPMLKAMGMGALKMPADMPKLPGM